jgi:hypothetical protein
MAQAMAGGGGAGTSVATASPDTWFAYKTADGLFGLAKVGSLPANAARTVEVGTSKTLAGLVQDTAMSGAISHALVNTLRIPGKLWVTLIGQLDAGAVLHDPSFVEVGPTAGSTGQVPVKSDAPTGIGSEAVSSPIIPSPNIGGVSIVGVLGNLDFWKGIGLVLAGAAILIIAGLELRSL